MIGPNDGLFIVIGGSQSHVPFIRAAQDLGYRTAVFDRSPSAPGAAVADTFFPISTHAVSELTAECSRMSRDESVVGIVTYSSDGEPLRAAAEIAETLGLHACPPEVVETITDKLRMKSLLVAAGIPTTDWARVGSAADVADFLVRWESPVVVKPSGDAKGSAGVSLVTGESDIPTLFASTAEMSQDGSVIAERYVEGREFSVGGIVNAGRPIVLVAAEKHSLGPEHGFVISGFSMGHVSASDHEWRESMDTLQQVALDAVSALGIADSLFTVDLLLDEHKGPLVLEAGILLDAKIDRLLWFSGLDIYDLVCRAAAGLEVVDPSHGYDRGYAIKFMFADRDGTLGIDDSHRDDSSAGCDERILVEWERAVGDSVRVPRSIADTVGWVLAEHDEADSSYRSAVDLARGRFHIEETGAVS